MWKMHPREDEVRLGVFDNGRLGRLDGDAIQDVTDWAFAHSPRRTDDPLIAFLHALTEGGTPDGPMHSAKGVRWRAPLREPGKIIAAAANYWEHTREMNPGKENPGGIYEKGFFLKAPTSIIGCGEAVRLPFVDRRTDQEAELAVVIGKTGRHLAVDRVMDHIFGYTCLLDITVRGKEDRGLRKSFDTFTPIGPYVTTREEVPDPNALEISCTVNGAMRQHGNTRDMIMPVTELIAWISRVMTLHPGDVIATGTPAGVGPLAPGDRVEVRIERLGTLEVGVVGTEASD
jgi:2-keto-4-pentenoate hydratase/2-oxohepta-3-ene-1,7-dioic acid hydratase in catechol pathway